MRIIDLMRLGHPRLIGTWVVDDVIVDCGPTSCLDTLIEGLDDEPPAALLLTHIHFDHAAAAGSLVQRWPDLRVYVHERGARHMADPERLYNSARRLYGDDMERLWGEMLPVPEANIEVLHGGETIRDGWEVAYTPGHASHHVCYLHDGTAFVGDVAGVRINPGALVVPPTLPPEVDVEAWHESIETVRRWGPQRLAMTHFGESTDVDSQLDELSERLDRWSRLARDGGRERFVSEVQAEILADGDADTAARYEETTPVEHLYLGYERYWAKRSGD